MLVFGVGAVVPVLAIAYASRRALLGRRPALARIASTGRTILGILLVLVGALTTTGVDKRIEAWMVEHMPGWLIDLTTAI
jgi:hypothetical protein